MDGLSKIKELIKPLLAQEDIKLYDVSWQQEGKNRILQVAIMRKDGSIEAAIEVFCKSQNDFLFMEKIQALEDVEDVTLIQYNGEYHG